VERGMSSFFARARLLMSGCLTNSEIILILILSSNFDMYLAAEEPLLIEDFGESSV
jgi:hypothetical protein